ncbi:carboxylate--amine ligase [Streptomyces fulvoviolaceus]|uniref:carboxylate--amine ligase n=1 Tax=Streptomyces fulvoviolaceus TaxID=285535 RepID=UPI0021C1E75B|nr:ATP-grasp domain-containing protein [Streptomyces fulvoviolaceus]MCT9078357.1 ATP-grasp domain-containing protein [Streptomyces fulvoviolaceus]
MSDQLPALLVKVGRFPQLHGGLGVVRTLGRMGVPAYAMVEDRFTPAALSSHLAGRFIRPTTGREDTSELVSTLLQIGREIGRPTVAVPEGDEAAVLLAENAGRLAEWFVLPPVPPALPRTLASKEGLHRICQEHGVPTPRTRSPVNRAELVAVSRAWGFPVVLKDREAFTKLNDSAMGHTTVVHDEAELLARCGAAESPSVIVQEYIPLELAEEWFTHLYCSARGIPRLVFTGHKFRSWPPKTGLTTRARARPNTTLATLAVELCRAIGYCGIADLDWRFDRRDGRYKLVDFNPRFGQQFRLFSTTRGLDVVRALYLDLTGQHVPDGVQIHGRGFIVGNLDAVSATVSAWRERRLPAALPRRNLERAWLCRDDPVPAVAEAVRFSGTVARRLTKPLRAVGGPDKGVPTQGALPHDTVSAPAGPLLPQKGAAP